MVLKWPQTTLEWPRYGSKWPKIDILMILSRSHFKMNHWLSETGYSRNRINEICSNETHSLIHWYNDLLNIPISPFQTLKKLYQTVLRTNKRYLTKIVPRRRPQSYFWFLPAILMVKKYPIYPRMAIIEILKSRPSAICIVTFVDFSSWNITIPTRDLYHQMAIGHFQWCIFKHNRRNLLK